MLKMQKTQELAAILDLRKLSLKLKHLKHCANRSILENINLDLQSALKVYAKSMYGKKFYQICVKTLELATILDLCKLKHSS